MNNNIMNAYEAYESASRTVSMLLDNQAKMLECMWDEIEKIPDDETVEISAGTLKSFIRTYNTTLSYLNGDMDKVKDYLTSKNLI